MIIGFGKLRFHAFVSYSMFKEVASYDGWKIGGYGEWASYQALPTSLSS
jgi:hypothetical protein